MKLKNSVTNYITLHNAFAECRETSSINFALHNQEERGGAREKETETDVIEVRSRIPELVHTNFLIPPCSLASGCVTGAYAAHCIYRVCVSSSPLPHSWRPLRARARHPRCTLYVYLSQKIISFIYTSFFNRSRIKREVKEDTEGERERERTYAA